MKTIFIAIILLYSSLVLGKAGPAIPAPSVTYHHAHDLALKELASGKHNVDPNYFPAKEYILASIEYLQVAEKWLWVVKFVHPVANDHMVIYHVNKNSVVTLYGATE